MESSGGTPPAKSPAGQWVVKLEFATWIIFCVFIDVIRERWRAKGKRPLAADPGGTGAVEVQDGVENRAPVASVPASVTDVGL